MRINEILNESWPTFFKALDMLRKAKKFKHLPDDKLEKMAHEVAKKWDSGVKTAPKKTQHKVQDLTKQYKQDKQQMGDEEFFNYYGFSRPKTKVTEKWSKKYKDSIDCSNPKGFSQRAHCDGKKKTNEDWDPTEYDFGYEQGYKNEPYNNPHKEGTQQHKDFKKGYGNGQMQLTYDNIVKKDKLVAKESVGMQILQKLEETIRIKNIKEDYDADLPVVMSLIIEALDNDSNWNLDGNVNWDYVASDVWIAFEYKEMGYDDEEFNDLYMDAAERVAERFGTNPPYHGGLAMENFADGKKKESYTREELPQIKNKHLENIEHEIVFLNINDVVPVQKERVMENFKRQVGRLLEGKYSPVIVDCNNRIVNGHHRYDAVKLLGETTIPVARIPHTLEYIIENFADGKKPGRKGLAKRMGVDCSKSVTALRKIAKNSSGEKQRMAHWCANMKSGKKK